MRRFVPVALFFLLALLIGTSHAVEGTWFGPIRYQRTEGQPNLYTAAFPGLPGQGTLFLKNGGSDEMGQMSSVLILVNGEQILRPNDFGQEIYGKVFSINLASNNSLIVEARGEPGDYLTVQVVQEIGWLFFHEGDPGIPGDGVAIDGVFDGDPWFDLATPVSLGQFQDGFTMTVFLSKGKQADRFELNPIVATLGYGPYDECQFSFGSGLFSTGEISYNGAKGFFTNFSDSLIQGWVNWSNQLKPECNLTADDLFLIGFAVWKLDDFAPKLDAAIILSGQNAFP